MITLLEAVEAGLEWILNSLLS